MKIDLELSPAHKNVARWALVAAFSIGVIGIGVAIAAPIDTTWIKSGDPVSSTQLKTALKTAEDRLAALETWQTTAKTQVADQAAQIAKLQGQSHPASAFSAVLTKTVSIPNATGTKLVFDREDYDLNSEYDPATGVFTVGQDGYYLVTCGLWYPHDSNSSGQASVGITKGAAELIGTDTAILSTSNDSPVATVQAKLSAGDKLACAAWQTYISTIALPSGFIGRSYFQAIRLN